MWVETAGMPPKSGPALINLDHVHWTTFTGWRSTRRREARMRCGRSVPGGRRPSRPEFTREEAEAFLEVLRDKIGAISHEALVTQAAARTRVAPKGAEDAREGAPQTETKEAA